MNTEYENESVLEIVSIYIFNNFKHATIISDDCYIVALVSYSRGEIRFMDMI